MRNMSFSVTKQQVIDETKTETRRLGWWNLKPGDIVMAVEKGMGLKRGEEVKKLKPIIVTSAHPERLEQITATDVIHEGFPGKSVEWFICIFCRINKCDRYETVNVIRFRYENP